MGRKFWSGLLLALCLMGCLFGATGAKAAQQSGLVTVKATSKEKAQGYTKRYLFYNSKGKAIQNKWKTVTVNGNKVKMYFGKDGKAYQAPKAEYFSNNVKVYTIDGAKYGFDTGAKMVTGYVATGDVVDPKFYFFNNKGKYDAAKTKTFKNAIKKGTSTSLKNLVKLLGTPKKRKAMDICQGADWEGELWTYHNLLQIQMKRNVNTGKELLIAISAQMKGL